MYGHKHPLAYQTNQGERFLTLGGMGFTFKQAFWLLLGSYLSYKMMKYVPNLPFNSLAFKHLHHFIPLAACYLLGFTKEGKTGLPLYQYFHHWIKFRKRPKTLIYKRGSGLS